MMATATAATATPATATRSLVLVVRFAIKPPDVMFAMPDAPHAAGRPRCGQHQPRHRRDRHRDEVSRDYVSRLVLAPAGGCPGCWTRRTRRRQPRRVRPVA